MKHLLNTTLTVVMFAAPSVAQDLPRPSPRAQTMQQAGLTEIEVSYGRPAVRGREIFGGLVPFDRVWRTGANEATTVRFSSDVKVEGESLPAGLYSLHTIPSESEWTVIFNREAEQWGSYQYDESKDALRVKVRPRVAHHPHERLTIGFSDISDDAATMMIEWADVTVPLRIEVPTRQLVLAGLREAMAANPEDWRIGYRAANWAFDTGVALDEAMRWLEQSISRNAAWANQALRARMLAASGRYADAIAAAERAIAAGRALQPAADTASLESDVASWHQKVP